MLDSTPEETLHIATQTRSAIRPRRNVGERRYVDILEGSDTQHGPELSSLMTLAFLYLSPSDFLTPLTNCPHRQMLVAEEKLTWSSNPNLTGNAQTTYFVEVPTGKFPNKVSERDTVSEISSTKEQDLRKSLHDCDADYN